MNNDIIDLIHSLNYIDNMIYFNNQEVKALFNTTGYDINRINELFAHNHKLIQQKNEILQNDKLKKYSEKDIHKFQILLSKKFY